jgi:hypothetical protein
MTGHWSIHATKGLANYAAGGSHEIRDTTAVVTGNSPPLLEAARLIEVRSMGHRGLDLLKSSVSHFVLVFGRRQ